MGDKVTFDYGDKKCCGIIVGFTTTYNEIMAIIRLDNGYYIARSINSITYCNYTSISNKL